MYSEWKRSHDEFVEVKLDADLEILMSTWNNRNLFQVDSFQPAALHELHQQRTESLSYPFL